MKQSQIDAVVAKYPYLPDEAVVPIPVYCQLTTRSKASADRDIATGVVQSVLIGGSRRITVASIRALFHGATEA